MSPDIFTTVEENIKSTFKINVLHPLPEKSIRIWHPHGITAVATGIHNVFKLTDFKQNNSKVVVHDWFYYFPLGGDILTYFNCMPSGFNVIKKESEHNSITLALGGVDEMGRIKNKQLELVIKNRKGIFRIALETGMPIVPVLTYGENELFPEADNEFLLWINSKLYEYFRLRTFFPSIKSLRNWLKLTTQPLDPIYTYTGRPIYVKKIENPSPRQIDILRKIYIQRVRELFKETNNGEYTLKIV
jgi:2-acylglycerol O-acyltransferase 2